eukprot:PRCOL_00006100-RA
MATALVSSALGGVAARRSAARSLAVGEKAPNFKLADQNGTQVSLSGLQLPLIGKPVVLFFYPSDGSPGCTKEAGAFRDAIGEFKAAGATVIGISNGSIDSHKQFQLENDLPFALLCDDNDEVREAYGVKPALFGALPGRETFVIAKDGTCVMAFNDLFDSTAHVGKALEALQPANVMA